jgi:hypothetical protein
VIASTPLPAANPTTNLSSPAAAAGRQVDNAEQAASIIRKMRGIADAPERGKHPVFVMAHLRLLST